MGTNFRFKKLTSEYILEKALKSKGGEKSQNKLKYG